MTRAGVVVDGAGLALSVLEAFSARGIELVSRDNFAVDSIKNMFVLSPFFPSLVSQSSAGAPKSLSDSGC